MKNLISWTVEQNGIPVELKSDKTETLLEAVQKKEGLYLDAPCGGRGSCGKCAVTIVHPGKPENGGTADVHLPGIGLPGETILACKTRPVEGLVIRLPDTSRGDLVSNHIPAARTLAQVTGENPITTLLFPPFPGTMEDQRDDLNRFLSLPGAHTALVDQELLPELHRRLNGTSPFGGVFLDNRLIDLVDAGSDEKKPATSPGYLAVDIGTTTVVMYLMDAETGKTVDILSEMNSQKSFGADVISRMEYAQKNDACRKEIQNRITGQLTRMAETLAKENGWDKNHIYRMVIAANTVMVHLLLGLPTETISQAPFIPVVLAPAPLPARAVGIELARCTLEILPGLSAYVGADITSGILAVEIHTSEKICLFLDAGTNGEIALGNRDGLVACSTAAGPAFEGAQLACGTGGVPGAVSRVKAGGKGLIIETIENKEPGGICGSGIVDALAVFLDLGAVDETGRIDSEFSHPDFPNLVEETNGECRLVLHRGKNREVYLTQKDLREIQLAKAAIAAGIRTLITISGHKPEDIDKIYLAGGFGYYINEHSAVRIGLIPSFLAGKVIPSGNTSGWGAVLTGASRQSMDAVKKIPKITKTIELSGDPDFQNHYIEEMMFPEL